MNRLFVILFAFAMAAVLPISRADQPQAEDFVVEGKVVINAPTSDPVTAIAAVAFVGEYAVAAPLSEDSKTAPDFKEGTVFDLKNGAWHYSEKGAWVNLESCRKWEAASMERSKQSLANAPSDDFRSFFESMIKPAFEVIEQDNGQLVVSNSHFKYGVTPDTNASPTQLSRFLAYDRLNAYHKAMTERGFPPTPTLALDEVLTEQKVFPARMTASIWSPNGDVKMTSDWKIQPITPAITAEVKAAVEAASQQSK
jgi:hypothetical protein